MLYGIDRSIALQIYGIHDFTQSFFLSCFFKKKILVKRNLSTFRYAEFFESGIQYFNIAAYSEPFFLSQTLVKKHTIYYISWNYLFSSNHITLQHNFPSRGIQPKADTDWRCQRGKTYDGKSICQRRQCLWIVSKKALYDCF